MAQPTVAPSELEGILLDGYRQIGPILAATPCLGLDGESPFFTDTIKLMRITHELSAVAVGQTVQIATIHDEPIIEAWGISLSNEEITRYGSKDSVKGTIEAVHTDGLRIQPQSFTLQKTLREGWYKVPILGEDGEPLVKITPRLAGLRDRDFGRVSPLTLTGKVFDKLIDFAEGSRY